MEQILRKDWNYILYEDDGRLLFSVVCGTTAIFDRTIYLSDDEILQYEEDREVYIDFLAEKIRFNPDNYKDRHVIL